MSGSPNWSGKSSRSRLLKRENSSTRTTGRFLSGSIALLALFVTSCTSTSTGTGTGLDGKPLQLAAGADGSMIADTLQSAADQTVAAENLKAKADEPGATKPTATASTSSTDTNNKETAKADADASSEAREPTELTALAPQPQKTSLFSMFGNSKPAEAKPDESGSQAEKPQETAATAVKQTEPAKAQDVEAAKPAQAAEKPIQVSSLFGSSKTAYASAQLCATSHRLAGQYRPPFFRRIDRRPVRPGRKQEAGGYKACLIHHRNTQL
ncbi:putative peptidase M15A [Brucella vulpis]|nr:putative peptidase M15A [Brucella vulpis]CUW50882.1 putative peptidase M15A [Brucella vulpis]